MSYDIQPLLDNLLAKELEKLRKIFLPYKRRPLLFNKINIQVGEERENAAGYYTNTKDKEHQWRYEHNIYITPCQIETYLYFSEFMRKRVAIHRLKAIIRHEIIHAFVEEEFEGCYDIKDMNADYSPVFLSCLYWCGGITNHPYTGEFLKTDLWKEVSVCKKYDDVYLRLIKYLSNLESCVRQINATSISKNLIRSLNIKFNSREAGISKKYYQAMELISKKEGKILKRKCESLTLGIGYLVTPDILKNNYKKKFNNGALAEYHSETIGYCMNEEIKHEVSLINTFN